MNTPTFSERLKKFRSAKGLTQKQLADLLGVSTNYVGMLESGREVDRGSALVKLFALYEKQGGLRGARDILKISREKAGLSQADLAKQIGYDIGVLQAIEDGSASASEAMIEKICAVLPDMDKDELMGGSDSPSILSESGGTYGSKPKIDLPPGMTARMVPLISWAQAGAMTSFADDCYQREGHIAFNVKDRRAFALKIRGDSMSPNYGEGDVVILYPSQEPRNGGLVIARLTEEKGCDVMFKIFSTANAGKVVTLTSYNPAHPPLTFSREDFAWIYPVASVVKNLI